MSEYSVRSRGVFFFAITSAVQMLPPALAGAFTSTRSDCGTFPAVSARATTLPDASRRTRSRSDGEGLKPKKYGNETTTFSHPPPSGTRIGNDLEVCHGWKKVRKRVVSGPGL